MARSCPVPGCQVLCITSAPLCTRHWECVSEAARKVYVKAEKRAAAAEGDCDHFRKQRARSGSRPDRRRGEQT